MRCRGTCRSCPTEWKFWWRTVWLMEAPVCGSRSELSRGVPECAGDAGRGVPVRYGSARWRPDSGRAVAVSSGAQRAGDGETARLAGGAVLRAKNGVQLRSGQGDHLSVAALESLDDV